MDQILAQVTRARRRLWIELFLNRLMTCLFVCFGVALIAMAVPKFVAIAELPSNWTQLCAILGGAAGVLSALIWTLVSSLSNLEAAVELDSRFELKERVSSSLALLPEDASTPAGQALLKDAARAIERVEVGSRFGISIPRKRWLPVLTTAAAFLVVSLITNPTAQSGVDPHAAEHAKEQRENVSKNLRKRIVEKKKQAAEKGLKEAVGLFEQLEKETEKLRQNPKADQKQSLVKLNDLASQLEKRRNEVGSQKEMRRQLANLDKLNQGPAEKMAQAMKDGNWQKALNELQKLNEKVKTGDLTEADKKALEEQLKKMQEKLSELAKAHEQSMDELKKQIEKQKEQGNLARAGELQQKLDQMQSQQNQMNQLNQLGMKMNQAGEAMKSGDMSKAAEAMNQMAQQMQSLSEQMQEGAMLDAALAEMQMAKDAMACQSCSGEGCESCQGAQGIGNKQTRLMGGSGAGKGSAWNKREGDVDAKFRDSRVSQETGRGPSVVVGEADGPNRRGEVTAAIETEMATAGGTPADPQVIEQLPKSRREHAQEYFDLIREGR